MSILVDYTVWWEIEVKSDLYSKAITCKNKYLCRLIKIMFRFSQV